MNARYSSGSFQSAASSKPESRYEIPGDPENDPLLGYDLWESLSVKHDMGELTPDQYQESQIPTGIHVNLVEYSQMIAARALPVHSKQQDEEGIW